MTTLIYFDLTLEKWKELSDYLTKIKSTYNKNKNNLNKKEKIEIEKKLRMMEYFLWINSPEFKNKNNLKESIYLDCLKDFQRFQKRYNPIC